MSPHLHFVGGTKARTYGKMNLFCANGDMMAYAILRIEKHTALVTVRRSGKHKDREQETPNANPELTLTNETEGTKTSAELVVAVQSRVNLATVKATGTDKPVIAVEYLITASPEFFKNSDEDTINAYFDNAKSWLRKKHGADNVVSITRHNDEKTPHLSAFVVPLVERQESIRKRSVIVGKDANGNQLRETREYSTPASINLSAKHFFGGAKALSELQTEFHQKVGIHSGLERGIEGSKANHQRVKTFYANITQGEKPVEVPKERLVYEKSWFRGDLVETDADFAERVAQSVKDQLAPVRDVALLAVQERQKRREAENTATEFRKRSEPLLKPLQGLSVDQVKDVLRLASNYQRQNEVERQGKQAQATSRGRKGR